MSSVGASPEVTRRGPLSMQLCVPADWSDADVVRFAYRRNWAGTALAGGPERQPCADRPGFVHIMLDC